MRQRKLKDLDERMEKHKDWFIESPQENKGKWKEVFQDKIDCKKLFLEVGCGKGNFLTTYAKENPDCGYIAIEGQASVIVRATAKAENLKLNNILFTVEYLLDVDQWFEEGELDGVYLNFSDPWPKDRHAKRRLTHRSYLQGYCKAIKDGGFIQIKTDNEGLFDFTLEEIADLGLEIEELSRDLHQSEYTAKEIKTEYEEKFSGIGKNINYVKIIVKK